MKLGEIWWANLPNPYGSGPGYRRPVVIIQQNSFNESSINTIIVVVITSNLHLSKAPGNIRINKKQSLLDKDSVINISQVYTIDKTTLTEKVALLSSKTIKELKENLKMIFDL